MSLVELSDIAKMLAQDIERLCADVLPRGRREGSEWVEASTANGGYGDSLKVSLRGARQGVWKHFSSGACGDALELVAYCLYNGDKKKAIAYAKDFLGLEKADPKELQAVRRKAQAAAKRREAQAQQEQDKKRGWAQSIWHNANPKLAGTPVENYLFNRGIALKDLQRVPGAIRFGSRVMHSPSKHEYPAMVAQINNAGGEFIAVHRTYLAPQGSAYIKAPIGETAKMVLGNYAGGFIPINRGASGKAFKDAIEGETIILCEGIEDGLSLAVAVPEYRIHACISAGNFKNQQLPPAITEVIIAIDNDPATIKRGGVDVKHPAVEAVEDAVDHFAQQGKRVLVARSPQGKDFNDCLRGGAAPVAQGA